MRKVQEEIQSLNEKNQESKTDFEHYLDEEQAAENIVN